MCSGFCVVTGMFFEIDFESGEAIYRQLCHQIIMGIATNTLQDGDSLPSVRDMADEIGINMHTVNKAYAILRAEGFLSVDRRRGAVVDVSSGKREALEELKEELTVVLAKAFCRQVSIEEVHSLIDELYREYGCT